MRECYYKSTNCIGIEEWDSKNRIICVPCRKVQQCEYHKNKRENNNIQEKNCYECGFLFTTKQHSEVTCSKKCYVSRRNKLRVIRSQRYCECGNASHSRRANHNLCYECIKGLLFKQGYVRVDIIPTNNKQNFTVKCLTCNNNSRKSVHKITQNMYMNCRHCTYDSRGYTQKELYKTYKNKIGYIYLLKKGMFYKVGITYKPLGNDGRVTKFINKGFKLIELKEVSNMAKASSIELSILNFIKDNNLYCNTNYEFGTLGGFTETISSVKIHKLLDEISISNLYKLSKEYVFV